MEKAHLRTFGFLQAWTPHICPGRTEPEELCHIVRWWDWLGFPDLHGLYQAPQLPEITQNYEANGMIKKRISW